jgi:LPXTG-site transpeptidase (sortase) family protein
MARTSRRSARVLLGLALAAAMLAGGCAADDVSTGDLAKQTAMADAVREPTKTTDSTPEPTESTTAEPPEESDEPAASGAPDAADASGNYTLRIPAVGMNVPVIAIQSTADRVLLPPADPGVGGWWSQGAAPGAEQGSAVIVGHSVRTGGGAFNAIGDLRNGDTVEVNGTSGAHTYRVESIEVLSKDELAREAERIFDQQVSGRLVVITCEDWDGQVWQSNVVAIATPA